MKRKRVDAGFILLYTRRFLSEMQRHRVGVSWYFSSDRLRPLHRRKNVLTPQRGIKASSSASLLPHRHSPQADPCGWRTTTVRHAEWARASSEGSKGYAVSLLPESTCDLGRQQKTAYSCLLYYGVGICQVWGFGVEF